MTKESKTKIQELVAEHIKMAGSQNKFSAKVDISAATLSNLKSGAWALISLDMWAKLASAVGYSEEAWNVVPTQNFIKMTALMKEAKTYGEVYAFLSPKGSSKTESVRCFSNDNGGVAVLACEEHWTKREFLSKLHRALGQDDRSLNIGELMDAIEMVCIKQRNPLIVLDEIDKVSDNLLLFFVSLYNRLNGKCGVFICCTDYLEERITKGIRRGKKGYAEFFSRMGGKFIKGSTPTATDIVNICKANGVTDQSEIDKILDDCDSDLRRVKRLVKANTRKKAAAEVKVQTATSQV